MSRASSGDTPMLGMVVPGTSAAGATIQCASASGRFGTRPAM